jgi:hypothetical protein
MEQRVSIITLGVADLKRSREFYDASDGGARWRRLKASCSSKQEGWRLLCIPEKNSRSMRMSPMFEPAATGSGNNGGL